MNLQQLKSIFLKSLIGCLVAAAAIAVVSVIIGHFNNILFQALFTIFLVAAHCLISFAFIINNEKEETFDNLSLFTNVTFFIIVLSFITSTLGVWHAMPGWLVGQLYTLYFVILFATLHGEILNKTTKKQKNIDNVVLANYLFMTIVVIMLVPVIFSADKNDIPSFYYRALAAAGIIDATLTLIAVILHKLYLQKHPKTIDNVFNVQNMGPPGSQPTQPAQQGTVAAPKRGMNIFVKVLIVYIVLQFLGGVVIAGLGAFKL